MAIIPSPKEAEDRLLSLTVEQLRVLYFRMKLRDNDLVSNALHMSVQNVQKHMGNIYDILFTEEFTSEQRRKEGQEYLEAHYQNLLYLLVPSEKKIDEWPGIVAEVMRKRSEGVRQIELQSLTKEEYERMVIDLIRDWLKSGISKELSFLFDREQEVEKKEHEIQKLSEIQERQRLELEARQREIDERQSQLYYAENFARQTKEGAQAKWKELEEWQKELNQKLEQLEQYEIRLRAWEHDLALRVTQLVKFVREKAWDSVITIVSAAVIGAGAGFMGIDGLTVTSGLLAGLGAAGVMAVASRISGK